MNRVVSILCHNSIVLFHTGTLLAYMAHDTTLTSTLSLLFIGCYIVCLPLQNTTKIYKYEHQREQNFIKVLSLCCFSEVEQRERTVGHQDW